MTTLILASSEKAREQILASMEEQTRTVATHGAEKLQQLQHAGIMLYYQLGELINTLSKDETIDGEGEITKLAQYWGIDNTNKLYEWRNTALTFDKEFLMEQASQALPNGKEITFEHFKALRRVKDEKTRNSLLKKVRKESWSAQELALEIRGGGRTNAAGQGRNPSIPSSTAALVKKCYTFSQQLYRYMDAIGDEASNRFEELPADEATIKLIDGLTDAIDMLSDLQPQISEFAAVLKTGRERVNTIIRGTEAAEVESDTDNVLDDIIEGNRIDVMESPQSSVEDLRERTVASVATAAKKRGRPKGSKNKASADSAVVGKKKRGRPKGSKNKVKASDETAAISISKGTKRGQPRASNS